MAQRDYIAPKIPSNWAADSRTYANMVQNLFDDLYMPVQEEYLSDGVKAKLNKADGVSLKDYSYTVQDVGIKWVDGTTIRKVTITKELTAGTVVQSSSIDELGSVIRFEGYAQVSAALRYPVGFNDGTDYFQCWQSNSTGTFNMKCSRAATVYVTAYYLVAQVEPPTGTLVYFDHGWVNDEEEHQIEWSDKSYAIPASYSAGSTFTLFSTVGTSGYIQMYMGAGTQSQYTFTRHVNTTNTIKVPTGVTKLKVVLQGANTMPKVRFGLIHKDASNCFSTTLGGQLSAWATITSTKTEYELTLDSSVIGVEDTYKLIVAFSGAGGARRDTRIYKVYFE